MITEIKWQKFNDMESFDSENIFDGQAYFNGGAAAVRREYMEEDIQGEYHAGSMGKKEYQQLTREYQDDYAAANARAAATKAAGRGDNYQKVYNAKNKQYLQKFADTENEQWASDDQHRKDVAAWQKKQAASAEKAKATRASKKAAAAAPAPVKKTIAKKATTTRKTVTAPTAVAAVKGVSPKKPATKKPAEKKLPAKTSKKKIK